MIGPKVLISILETRYRENDMLFEATGPRPRGPGGRRQRTRTQIEKDLAKARTSATQKHQAILDELQSALEQAKKSNIPGHKVYRAWVLKHGEQRAIEVGLPPPAKGTPEGDAFYELLHKDAMEVAAEYLKSPPKPRGERKPEPTSPSEPTKPAEEPIKPQPETERPPERTPSPRRDRKPPAPEREVKTGEVIFDEPKKFSLDMPETYPLALGKKPAPSTGAIVPATTERFPKPVGEPDTTALARRRTDIQKARETGKYPLEKYRGGTPVEITPPPPPPPPSPTLPKPSDRELAPGRDEFTSFSLPQQGAYYAYDVGIVRDIPGMARLAHQWRIA